MCPCTEDELVAMCVCVGGGGERSVALPKSSSKGKDRECRHCIGGHGGLLNIPQVTYHPLQRCGVALVWSIKMMRKEQIFVVANGC